MPSKRQIILKKLKEYDTLWHPESALVFKSSTDKKVIGRIEDNELIQLDEKTIELCEQWNFEYDESLIEEEQDTSLNDKTSVEDNENSDGDEIKEVVKSVEDNTKTVVKENQNNNCLYDNKVQQLGNVINEFQKNIMTNMEEIRSHYENIIRDLEKDLQNSRTECTDYKQKYETLKTKFDGIKSLFS